MVLVSYLICNGIMFVVLLLRASMLWKFCALLMLGHAGFRLDLVTDTFSFRGVSCIQVLALGRAVFMELLWLCCSFFCFFVLFLQCSRFISCLRLCYFVFSSSS